MLEARFHRESKPAFTALSRVLAGLLTLVGLVAHSSDGAVLAATASAAQTDRWGTVPISLEELLQQFPPREATDSALMVEDLAAKLGVNIAPSELLNRRRPSEDDQKAFETERGEIEAYLRRELENPEAGAEFPPPDVAVFLSSREMGLQALRDGMARGRPPRWERRLERAASTPLPNLMGHLQLQRLLLADALAKDAGGDTKRALADLDASWALNTALRDEPFVICQLVAVSVTRMQAGTLRRLRAVPALWRIRLFEHNYRESMLRALHLAAWMWIFTEDRPSRMDGFLQKLAYTTMKPYFRMCAMNASGLWRESLRKLADIDSLCEADLAALDKEVAASFPWWNRFGQTLVINLDGSISRLARLELDLEMTGKLLDLRSARERSEGKWPGSSDRIEESAACPHSRWLYEASPDGVMSIALDRKVVWPDQVGIILPTRYRSAASTN